MLVAGSFSPARLSENSIGAFGTQIGEDNLAGVKPRSLLRAFVDMDRASIVFVCADIIVSRPNRNFAPLLSYHNNAVSINNYVEAEGRTIPNT